LANLRTWPAGACRSCVSDSAGPLPGTPSYTASRSGD
jgi:hypothetical protein